MFGSLSHSGKVPAPAISSQQPPKAEANQSASEARPTPSLTDKRLTSPSASSLKATVASALRKHHPEAIPETGWFSLNWMRQKIGGLCTSILVSALLPGMSLVLSEVDGRKRLRLITTRRLRKSGLFNAEQKAEELPASLPGRADLPTIVCIDGLAGRGQVWRNFGELINQRYGFPVTFSYLHGHHERDPVKLRHYNYIDWLSGLASQLHHHTSTSPRQPVFIFFSTSALGGIVAKSLFPERRVNALSISLPLKVDGSSGAILDAVCHFYERWPSLGAALQRLYMEQKPSENIEPYGFRYLPFQAYYSLWKLAQLATRVASSHNRILERIFIGEHDQYQSPTSLRTLLDQLRPNHEVTIETIPDMPHNILQGSGQFYAIRSLIRSIEGLTGHKIRNRKNQPS